MKRRRRGAIPGTIVLSLAIMLLSGAMAAWIVAAGTTRYVDASNCPGPGSGTLGDPFCKIQDAICVAASGDTVEVAQGIYTEAIRMRPGVSVISTSGATMTTIDAAGQPCTDNDWCTKRAGNQCSVVTFASGHTLATVLDGFTITGGQGLIQTGKVAGGGIYVFSSATITNNVITNNIISGPSPEGRDLRGAGVYVAVGNPVISNNSIVGNKAIPPAGGGQTITFGYGAGVWLNAQSAATVTNNIIQANVAGDSNLNQSIGSGGGMVVWPGAGGPGHVIDRNLIADNFADSQGGGVAVLSVSNTAATASITNNVIVGNEGTFGGGVYIYFNKTSLVNNTITNNLAFLGGGVYSGQSEVTLPISITNNIIEGNSLRQFGNGGGVYNFDLSATFEPTIDSNDLFGNDRNQCGGERDDASCIGVDGNFSDDPLYANGPMRDYHLDPNSPAIDRANLTSAPPVDRDDQTRGVDGNGVPDNPVTGDVDVGAYEFSGGCIPAPEICDGLDNDCDLIADNGFSDFDVDGMADCVDDDDDNDLVLDVSDCAPLDATAWGMPSAVTGLDATGVTPATDVVYDLQSIGPGTQYEVVSGLVGRVSATGGFTEGFCLEAATAGGLYQDSRPAPRVGEAWYYLVRSFNACGQGTLGTGLRDALGAGDVCTNGQVDLDWDGSPSNLDCNDGDPAVSPLLAEVCDGLDNNCDLIADEGNPGGGQTCGVSNVGTCQYGTTQCSSGSLGCAGDIGPGIEYCDNLDNDCDGIADNNVIDSDLDGLDDCTDLDDDNDLVEDVSDCAPLDATAFAMPVELSDIDVDSLTPTGIHWVDQVLGSGTVYDLGSGPISAAGVLDFISGSCVDTVPASPATDSRPAPAPDTVYYFLVKSRNSCGMGTYGTMARDLQPVCP